MITKRLPSVTPLTFSFCALLLWNYWSYGHETSHIYSSWSLVSVFEVQYLLESACVKFPFNLIPRPCLIGENKGLRSNDFFIPKIKLGMGMISNSCSVFIYKILHHNVNYIVFGNKKRTCIGPFPLEYSLVWFLSGRFFVKTLV